MEASITQDTGIVKSHSGFGVAALIISTITFFLMLILFFVAGVIETTSPGGVDPESVTALLIGLFLFAFLLADILAIIFGVIGLTQKHVKKTYSILGIIFASGTILITLIVMFIGATN
jgi:hypothetical protein